MALPLTIRIANLNADTPVPNVLAQRGTYGNIFHQLLAASAARVAPGLDVQAVDFDVVRGEYPASLDAFDVLLITGSAQSSYDQDAWVRRLDAYLADVYAQHPRIKIFGSCFGHQIVCQSLLRNHGVFVEKDPAGWELGVFDVRLEPDFAKRLGHPSATDGDSVVRFQFIHADHVKVPEAGLPSPWMPMGRSAHCAVQGVYEPGRVLTYQGHFEFDRFVNIETVRVFGAKWDPAFLSKTIEAMDKEDDNEAAADMVMRFFMEGRSAVPGEGGLMTPPLTV
jgi:GMP synthase-like glutamine amidotransferase